MKSLANPFSIDMQVLADLKGTLVFMRLSGIAGDRPPRYGSDENLPNLFEIKGSRTTKMERWHVRDLAIPNYRCSLANYKNGTTASFLTNSGSLNRQTGERLIEVTDATFQSLVLDAELPVVVEFWAEWCPFCRQMKPVVEAVASEHSETFTIARLDIEANRQTTGTYGIQGIPTYLVFRDGEVVGRLVGAMPKASFVSGILELLK